MQVMSLYVTPKDKDTPITVYQFVNEFEFTIHANVYGQGFESGNINFDFKLLDGDTSTILLKDTFPVDPPSYGVEQGDNMMEFILADIKGQMSFENSRLPNHGLIEISATSNENTITTKLAFFKEV